MRNKNNPIIFFFFNAEEMQTKKKNIPFALKTFFLTMSNNIGMKIFWPLQKICSNVDIDLQATTKKGKVFPHKTNIEHIFFEKMTLIMTSFLSPTI